MPKIYTSHTLVRSKLVILNFDYNVEILDDYFYTEAKRKKIGNNAVSFIQKSLEKKGCKTG